MIKIFVYGGLIRKGHYHQYYMKGTTFLGEGYIEGYKRYIFGHLSGILPENGERVQGEVYEADPAALVKLDSLHDNFTRGVVDVELGNGQTLPAETYIWNGSV